MSKSPSSRKIPSSNFRMSAESSAMSSLITKHEALCEGHAGQDIYIYQLLPSSTSISFPTLWRRGGTPGALISLTASGTRAPQTTLAHSYIAGLQQRASELHDRNGARRSQEPNRIAKT